MNDLTAELPCAVTELVCPIVNVGSLKVAVKPLVTFIDLAAVTGLYVPTLVPLLFTVKANTSDDKIPVLAITT